MYDKPQSTLALEEIARRFWRRPAPEAHLASLAGSSPGTNERAWVKKSGKIRKAIAS
jgi:hypothetical protein